MYLLTLNRDLKYDESESQSNIFYHFFHFPVFHFLVSDMSTHSVIKQNKTKHISLKQLLGTYSIPDITFSNFDTNEQGKDYHPQSNGEAQAGMFKAMR